MSNKFLVLKAKIQSSGTYILKIHNPITGGLRVAANQILFIRKFSTTEQHFPRRYSGDSSTLTSHFERKCEQVVSSV